MEGTGRQLTLGDRIVDIRDDHNNTWYMDGEKVYLKLTKENKSRLLGKFRNSTFYTKREKEKHLFRNANSYGFSIGVLEQLNPEFIELYEGDAVYRFPVNVLRQFGDYLHFKEEGFEKQLFLALPIIEKYRYTPEEDIRQIELLGEQWFKKIGKEFREDYMQSLGRFIKERRQQVYVYPPRELMFKAFKATPYENIKVIMIGQDPYYTKGVADGLAFSCAIPTYIPPSLQKVFDRIEKEVYNGLNLDRNPSLERWAKQGVLLLNTVLTVEHGSPKSHYGKGWEKFTSNVLIELKRHPHNLVVMLWGAEAKKLREYIDNDRHLVLEAEHPAAAHRNDREWDNHECFSKCNLFLEKMGYGSIEW